MEHRFQSSTYANEQEDSTSTPENDAESPLSAHERTVNDEPSPKKSRRIIEKKVISVPTAEVAGSRSKGEVFPPSDSWAWRKYGQKPIKGSSFPRAYYRCSSPRGCPARKQVERNHQDPTMLLITYSFEHNHPPLPTTSTHTHHHHFTTTSTNATTLSTTSSSANTTMSNGNEDKFPPEELVIFANQTNLELNSSFSDFNDYFSCWFSDVESTTILEKFVGPTCIDADVALMLPIGEEDQTLFGDLGELPECSMVFRRCRLENTC